MLCDVFAGIRWIMKLCSDCAWFLYELFMFLHALRCA